MNVLKQLATLFPGLPLDPPLYYSWPIALRFELNEGRFNPPDFDAVVDRASTLYVSVFAPSDVSHIISVQKHIQGFGRQRLFGYRPHQDNSLFSLARRYRLGVSRPSGVAKFRHTKKEIEDRGASRTRVGWTEVSPHRIDYRFILRKIAHEDFPIGAGVDGEVYFYNQARGIILHMYDDRGMDLIATTRAALQPIYDAHKGWLLRDDPRGAEYRIHRLGAVDFRLGE